MTDQKESDEHRFAFSYSFWVVLLIFVLILNGIYWWQVDDLNADLVFLGASMGVGAAVVTAYYSLRNYRLLITASKAQNRLEKKLNALRYVERWNAPNNQKLRVAYRAVVKAQKESDEEGSKCLEKHYVEITSILNFIEEIAAAVKFGTVNEDVMKNQFNGMVHAVWSNLRDFIKGQQDLDNRPKLWDEFKNLHHKWSS